MPDYALGAVPGPAKATDYQIARMVQIATAHPDEWMSKNMVSSEFQGGAPKCVAYALEHGAACKEWKERGVLTRFSQDFIYWAREPQHYQGDGMIPEEALWIWRHKGTPRQTTPLILPGGGFTPEALADALYQRIASYARCYADDEIKTALRLNGDYPNPVHICIPVYQSFYDCPANGMLPMPDTAREKLYGYHEVNIVGWIKDPYNGFRWVIQNWWQNWGDTQAAEFSMGYLPRAYPIIDMWTAVDATLPPPESDRVIQFRAGDKFITVNGQKIPMDVPVRVSDGRTWLPLRFAAEGLGGYVKEWDDRTQQGTIIIPARG